MIVVSSELLSELRFQLAITWGLAQPVSNAERVECRHHPVEDRKFPNIRSAVPHFEDIVTSRCGSVAELEKATEGACVDGTVERFQGKLGIAEDSSQLKVVKTK